MDLSDLLTLDRVVPTLKVEDKRQLLQDLADIAGRATTVRPREVFQALWHREQLGSTGMGRGVAIPHGRMAGVNAPVCAFVRLEQPIDFGSLDGEPVDLVFLLLAPEDAGADHLKALARIARLLRRPHLTEKLRASRDKAALYAILTEPAADPLLSKAS
jgi:nitrogen PTS system EIIA component